ncbi:hypothetical protein D1006_22240 [Burkholderia stabilis]|uniref:RiboL-PSP-HEPN domain-containing protein n=1 Tax=Burkholderia stabilis TaxID=95485 RepID=A0A4Q2AEX5_9BURK|nr:hypothetical protein [Burkholderia stabilis]RXV67947.1 hypothetical protein D1006_22240 [Burkholderia stabilis]
MKREAIPSNLSHLAFEFFFRFSRFEFALKENLYLKFTDVGAKAEPGWERFSEKWRDKYEVSDEARRLLDAPPMRQIVGPGQKLEWVQVLFTPNSADLDKVSQLLRIVRNNLFHGGKHQARDWDDPKRTESLLLNCLSILTQLADLSELTQDYEGFY